MFGKYLIDNNYIDEEQFVTITIAQLSKTPSLLATIKELDLLSTQELVELIEESYTNSRSVHQLVLDKMPEESIEKLFNTINEKSPSFGETATNLGLISNEDYFEALSKYKSDGESVENSVASEEQGSLNIISSAALESLKEVGGVSDEELAMLENSSEPVNEKVEEKPVMTGGISAAALESLKEVGGLSEDELKNLEQQTSEISSDKSDSISLSIVEKNYFSEVETLLSSAFDFDALYEKFRILLGSVKLNDLSKFEKFLTSWEKILGYVREREELKTVEFSSEFKKLFEISEKAVSELQSGKNEQEVFNTSPIKEDIIENIKNGLGILKK